MTLVIETDGPCPYLPMIAAFFTSIPVPRWQVERFGPRWASDENVVSNSSYKVENWRIGERLTLTLDAFYNGPIKGYLSEIRSMFRNRVNTGLLSYENDELDLVQIDVRDLSRIEEDRELSAELHKYMDFNAIYLFFRTREGVFSDHRVRKAISHAIDRDALCTRTPCCRRDFRVTRVTNSKTSSGTIPNWRAVSWPRPAIRAAGGSPPWTSGCATIRTASWPPRP